MGSFYLILALVFSLLIAIVALANNERVTVSYIFGRADVSLILLILGSAFTGALVMGLFSLFRSIRSALSFRQLRHRQDELQNKIKALEEEKVFLQAELSKLASAPEEEDEILEFKTAAEAETETENLQPESENEGDKEEPR